MPEISPTEKALAEALSSAAKERCKLIGLSCKSCEPRHFLAIVTDYSGKLTGLKRELLDCIQWVADKGKRQFTAMRFRNWCSRSIEFSKRRVRDAAEREKLKNGTPSQREDYRRRFMSKTMSI